jgi:hypothetical protein
MGAGKCAARISGIEAFMALESQLVLNQVSTGAARNSAIAWESSRPAFQISHSDSFAAKEFSAFAIIGLPVIVYDGSEAF